MADSQHRNKQNPHVAVFPPSRNAPRYVQTGLEPATARFQGDMDDCRTKGDQGCEEEDPERWDGMS